jgi:hypothetical protein
LIKSGEERGRTGCLLPAPDTSRFDRVNRTLQPLKERLHVYQTQSGAAGVCIRGANLSSFDLLERLKQVKIQLESQGYLLEQAYLNAQPVLLKGVKSGD